MMPIFKTGMSIYHSAANLDEKIRLVKSLIIETQKLAGADPALEFGEGHMEGNGGLGA